MSNIDLPEYQTKKCPYCKHEFSARKKKFSVKEFFSIENAHQRNEIAKLSKTNQFAAGVMATFHALNQFGVAELYLCPKCHLPFIS